MRKRHQIKATQEIIKPTNPLEEMLCYQSQFQIKLMDKIQADNATQFSTYQELCRTRLAFTSHYNYSILELIRNLKLPKVVAVDWELEKPTDCLKPIVVLIRPLFETISILKFIEVISTKQYPDDNFNQEKCKNDISEEIDKAVSYTRKFEYWKKFILDLPLLEKDRKGLTNEQLFEQLFKKELHQINTTIPNDEVYRRSLDNFIPKELWKYILDHCNNKFGLNIEYRPFIKPLEFAWLDDTMRDLSREIYMNLKKNKLENPWKGDVKEYEHVIMPEIAKAYLVYSYSSEVVHLDAKYLFQEVRSKAYHMWNLWRIIVLAYPEIYHEFITILCKCYDFDLESDYPEYHYERLKSNLGIWGNKMKDKITSKIKSGY